MKKTIWKCTFLILNIVFLTIFIGCQRITSGEKKIIKSYLNDFYTIDDYSKFTKDTITDQSFSTNYLKEKEFKNIMTSEIYADYAKQQNFKRYLLISNLGKFNSSVKNVNIDKYTTLQDKSNVYNFSANIEINFVESKEKKEEKVTGQVTLIKSNEDKWLISNINVKNEFIDNQQYVKFLSLQ